MPITTEWMYGKRVILQRQAGVVTGKQAVESIILMQEMIRQGDQPVHIFIDASAQEGQSDVGLGDLKHMIPKVVEGTGWTVIIQPSTFQRFFTSLSMQLAGGKHKFVKDEAEALRVLLEQDATLNGLIK